jgi:hypothetical protein
MTRAALQALVDTWSASDPAPPQAKRDRRILGFTEWLSGAWRPAGLRPSGSGLKGGE